MESHYFQRKEAKMTGHEALNPIHPSVLPHLDPVFIDLYNTHVANTPNKPIDLGILRSKYSVLYSYGTGPFPEPEKVYDAEVPGHNGDMIPVRVYNPNSQGPWAVHIDFHGGGGFIASLPFLFFNSMLMAMEKRLGSRRPRHRISHMQTSRRQG